MISTFLTCFVKYFHFRYPARAKLKASEEITVILDSKFLTFEQLEDQLCEATGRLFAGRLTGFNPTKTCRLTNALEMNKRV